MRACRTRDGRGLPEYRRTPQNTAKQHKSHLNAREITRSYSKTP